VISDTSMRSDDFAYGGAKSTCIYVHQISMQLKCVHYVLTSVVKQNTLWSIGNIRKVQGGGFQ